ncbi:MAG: RNA polymerase subunit sigma [Gemmatimonadetes bacterium]|nr:MAG: RNA polymerase subunit sigma [Gemmatimonadota bacterium]
MTRPERLSQERELTLLRRLKSRDQVALAELYDLLSPWVLGLVFRILQDAAEAEEVLSDVFVQVWDRIDQHDARRGPLVPWVLSIARNRALDALRRRRRWWRKAERWERARSAETGDQEPAPDPAEAAVPGWPVHQEVHRALAALPEEQRRVVLLAHFEGLTHSEIARRTGLPLGTVKTRLRMAHAKLAEALSDLKDWMA